MRVHYFFFLVYVFSSKVQRKNQLSVELDHIVNGFYCIPMKLLVTEIGNGWLDFQKFDCDVSWCLFLWVYPIWKCTQLLKFVVKFGKFLAIFL